MTEDQLEQETLAWLAEVGYVVHPGLAIAPDGANPQRADYHQVVLAFRLREAIGRLNPAVPTAAREDALQQVLNLGLLAQLTVDWSRRESVRASLRLMVKRILRKYKYPPDKADCAVELVLQQAEASGEAWVA